ncbi:MAG TPA: alpha/beta hydrolase [Candidatus Nanopelagicales bacterium]
MAATVGNPEPRVWTARVNGTGLRVEDVGTGAETVVFSPALFTNRALFDAPVAALCGDHRCIRYDHRGQGDSGFGAHEANPHLMGVEGLSEDAVALLDVLDVESCHWVGVSVGAMVGMRVAARHPDRVRSLTMIGVTVRPLTRRDLVPFFVAAGLIRATSRLGPVGSMMRRQVAGFSMRTMVAATYMSDPGHAADRERWRQRFAAQFVPEGLPMIREVFGFPGTPVEMLAHIQAPTLVIYGAEDPGADVEAEKAQHAIPGARLLAIPDAGHYVLVEQPDLATRVITDFIRGVEAAGA